MFNMATLYCSEFIVGRPKKHYKLHSPYNTWYGAPPNLLCPLVFMEMSSFFSNYFLVSFFSSRSPLPPRKATSIVYRKPSLAVMGQLQFLNYHITLFGGSFQPVQMSNFLCITIAIFITILYNLSFVGESPKTHGNH
jgi:hypothetical protein